MTEDGQPRRGDQCRSCGKRLTVDDKSRNRGTGLCWECFRSSPEARALGVKEEGVEPGPRKVTTMAPADVLRSVTDFVLARGRWQVIYQTEDQVTLQHFAGASCLIAFLLLFLGVIPAILYLLLAKGESRLVVRAIPAGACTQVEITWLGTNWRSLAFAFLETLPEASEEELARIEEPRMVPQAAAATSPPAEAVDREEVFQQIRELGRLREEGLITEEEFEAKKAELLARL
jgi:hypothetical protein